MPYETMFWTTLLILIVFITRAFEAKDRMSLAESNIRWWRARYDQESQETSRLRQVIDDMSTGNVSTQREAGNAENSEVPGQ